MSKVTSFPEGLDTANKLPDIRPSDRMNDDGRKHDVQHTTLNQAVIALQRKVGANGSEDEDSLDYKVRQLEEHGGGGAGLTPFDPDHVAGGSMLVPDRAGAWFRVTVDGIDYVVPGFRAEAMVAAEDFLVGLGFMYWSVWSELSVLWDASNDQSNEFKFAKNFTVKQLWED